MFFTITSNTYDNNHQLKKLFWNLGFKKQPATTVAISPTYTCNFSQCQGLQGNHDLKPWLE